MSETLIVSRKSLEAKAKEKLSDGRMGTLQLVDFKEPSISGKFAGMSQDKRFDIIDKAVSHNSGLRTINLKTGNSGFDIAMSWSDGEQRTVRDAIDQGMFSPSMSSNTLPIDWENLWDAMKIDVTVRKASLPTIRERIYNVTVDPNFSRKLEPTEINPFGVVFEENNGHGEAIPMGETRGGGYDVFYILIYAAGFTWDLMADLFDKTITPERVMDAVMVGYNAIRDDIAISPIINFSYSGTQQTAASTIGTLRQEKLYNTLVDANDDLGQRLDPVTDRKLGAASVKILASSLDAKHIEQVASGLPSTNERKYSSLNFISEIIAYDDEVIRLRDRSVTYSGVADGTAYMLIPASELRAGGYMEIAVKADLTVEVDSQPDVKTLAREERAYWFAEGIWYEGIQYFIQEITLPAW